MRVVRPTNYKAFECYPERVGKHDEGRIGVVAALVRSTFLVNAVYAESAREYGLTSQQGRLLCVLMAQPYGMSELGAMLRLAKSSLTGLVDRTERNGLVRRIPDPQDWRAVRIALTRKEAGSRRSSTARPAGESRTWRRGSPTPTATRSPTCSAASCWTTRSPWSSWSPAGEHPRNASVEIAPGCSS